MPLFTAQELADHLGVAEVSESRAQAAERLVWGWLAPILGSEEEPHPVPAPLFSWAIELGGIAYENPTSLTAKQLGPGQQQFSLERRREILAEAAAGGRVATTVSLEPRGSFPRASSYPDPAASPGRRSYPWV